MKDFDAVFDDALNARMTTRLRVTQLGGRTHRIGGKEWQWFCLCVTGKGCKCKNPILIMIGDILDRIGTGERTEDGDEIIEIVLPRDADVLRQRISRSSVATVVATTGQDGFGDMEVGFRQLKEAEAAIKVFLAAYNAMRALDDATGGAITDYVADKIEDTVDGVKDAIDTIKDWLD